MGSSAKFLAIVFGLLGVFSAFAYLWTPRPDLGDRMPLVWVSDNNPMRTEQIATFNAEHPDLHLSLDYGNTGTQKIVLQSSSGVGPDIYDVGGSEALQTYVEAGIAWDITEAAKRMGFSADGDVWPSAREEITYEGRQYSYPANVVADILIYNKNVFDYLGIPYPKDGLTWSEFVELGREINARAAAKDDLRHRIFAVGNLKCETVFESLHGEFFTEDGLPRIADSPELRKAFEMHKEFIFKYGLRPTSVEAKALSGQGGWGAGVLNQFGSGRFAMIKTGEWVLINLGSTHQRQLEELQARHMDVEDVANPLDRPLRLGCTLIPRFPDREPSYRVRSRSAAINVRSPNREKALEFLQYLAGPTYSRLINEGMDALPGNPEYSELGVTDRGDDLARIELHEKTKAAVESGYSYRKSPFLLLTDVQRVLSDQIGRLESNRNLEVDDLLKTAQRELQTLMRRNLDRDPDLKKLFIERFGEKIFRAL